MIYEDFLPVHPYFYPSKIGFTCPNARWTDFCIKLWVALNIDSRSGLYNVIFHIILAVVCYMFARLARVTHNIIYAVNQSELQ